jgi:hypothetical protein
MTTLPTPHFWQDLPRHAMLFHQRVGPAVQARIRRLPPGPGLQKTGWSLLDFLGKKFTDFDFREFPRVHFPGLKKVLGGVPFSEIPMGPLLVLLYLTVIPKRLEMAHRRQRNDDLTKESHDVLIRDMTSFFMLVFANPPFVRWMGRLMRPLSGLPLVNQDGIIPYSDLEEIYALKSPEGLARLATHPDTRQGFQKALARLDDRGFEALGFSPQAEAVMRFKAAVAQAIQQPSGSEAAQQAFQQAFAHLEALDNGVQTAAQQAMTRLKQTGGMDELAQTLVQRASTTAKRFQYRNFLVNYAKGFRLPGDISALLMTCLLAGWAPLALNDYLSLRAVKKYMSTHPNDAEATTGRVSPALAAAAHPPDALGQRRGGLAAHHQAAFQAFLA